MTLSDFILTYERDGKIVANLFDYYELFIKPLDKRFGNHSYYDNKLVLCWFKDHSDINPSMGWIRDRNHKGVYLYHCFGCGRTGNVIRLNQLIMSQYYNQELTEKESCLDLAVKFDIPIDDFDVTSDEDYDLQFEKRVRKVEGLKSRYTVKDFSDNLLSIRKSGKVDLNKVNSECVKLIATVKQLYI